MLKNRVAEVKLVSVPFFYLDEKNYFILGFCTYEERRGDERERENISFLIIYRRIRTCFLSTYKMIKGILASKKK